MSKKILIEFTLHEKGLIGKIKSFFLRRKLIRCLRTLIEGMPAEKFQEIINKALVDQGYKAEQTPDGATTYTKG
jgi:hypothetical protein